MGKKHQIENNKTCLLSILDIITRKIKDYELYSFGRVVSELGDRRFSVQMCQDKSLIIVRCRGSLRNSKSTSIRIHKDTPVIIYDKSEIFAFFNEDDPDQRSLIKSFITKDVIPASIKDHITYDGGYIKDEDIPFSFEKTDADLTDTTPECEIINIADI